MRGAIAALAVAAAAGVPLAIIYAAIKTMQMLAIGLMLLALWASA